MSTRDLSALLHGSLYIYWWQGSCFVRERKQFFGKKRKVGTVSPLLFLLPSLAVLGAPAISQSKLISSPFINSSVHCFSRGRLNSTPIVLFRRCCFYVFVQHTNYRVAELLR